MVVCIVLCYDLEVFIKRHYDIRRDSIDVCVQKKRA
jgi:hypothetical protein